MRLWKSTHHFVPNSPHFGSLYTYHRSGQHHFQYEDQTQAAKPSLRLVRFGQSKICRQHLGNIQTASLRQVWWLVHPTVKWHTRNELKFIWIVIFNSWDGYFHTCVYHRSIFLFKIEYMYMLWTFCINTVIDRCTCLINAWPAKSPLPQCFLHIYDCLAQLYVSSYATDFDGRVNLSLLKVFSHDLNRFWKCSKSMTNFNGMGSRFWKRIHNLTKWHF